VVYHSKDDIDSLLEKISQYKTLTENATDNDVDKNNDAHNNDADKATTTDNVYTQEMVSASAKCLSIMNNYVLDLTNFM
jgi:hypothetical protein